MSASEPMRVGRRVQFGTVAAHVMRDPDLSHLGKAVYALLATYADVDRSCFPSQERMAAELGVSVDTVQRGLRDVRDAGYLEASPRYAQVQGKPQRVGSDYRLLDVAALDRTGAAHRAPMDRNAAPPMDRAGAVSEQDQRTEEQELPVAVAPEAPGITGQVCAKAYGDRFAAVHGRPATGQRVKAVARDSKRLLDEGKHPEQVVLAALVMADRKYPSLATAWDRLDEQPRQASSRADRNDEVLRRAAARLPLTSVEPKELTA